jgi:heme exporter protein C
MLMYFAYLILRNSFDDELRRARISAIYNIFAFAVFIPLIFVLPRLTDSLHPGNGGNPAFGKYDMDNGMRLVLYPECHRDDFIGCLDHPTARATAPTARSAGQRQ